MAQTNAVRRKGGARPDPMDKIRARTKELDGYGHADEKPNSFITDGARRLPMATGDNAQRIDKGLAAILRALDRCEHGRHQIDPCLGCPGGKSTGNTYLQPGMRIGTDLYGRPIIFPEDNRVHTEPMYWLTTSEREAHASVHTPR